MTKTTDCGEYTMGMLDRLGEAYYIMKHLQPYMPPALANPLRPAQHR